MWEAAQFVSLLTGDRHEVMARNAVVDATYLEPTVPATSKPPFEVADGVQCVPVNELARVPEPPDGYVIIGAGKTGADAVLYLLENGVPPALIRWIKPREAWYLNRAFTQGGELLGTLFDGLAQQLEVCAEADSATALFEQLGQSRQMLRVDENITATMFRGPTVSTAEIELLRQIDGAVRLGRVRRIEAGTIRLDDGTIPTTSGTLHVHAAAGRPQPQRPRHPSLPPEKSGCSPCASVWPPSTPRSSPMSRRPGPTSRARTACARPTVNPTPPPTGSAAL